MPPFPSSPSLHKSSKAKDRGDSNSWENSSSVDPVASFAGLADLGLRTRRSEFSRCCVANGAKASRSRPSGFWPVGADHSLHTPAFYLEYAHEQPSERGDRDLQVSRADEETRPPGGKLEEIWVKFGCLIQALCSARPLEAPRGAAGNELSCQWSNSCSSVRLLHFAATAPTPPPPVTHTN